MYTCIHVTYTRICYTITKKNSVTGRPKYIRRRKADTCHVKNASINGEGKVTKTPQL